MLKLPSNVVLQLPFQQLHLKTHVHSGGALERDLALSSELLAELQMKSYLLFEAIN